MAASFLWVSRWLDGLRVAEEIGQRRPALIEPGWQAGFFFKSGWTWTRPAGQAAVATLARYGDDAKLLAGGHSLLPLMKLRLATPSVLVDDAITACHDGSSSLPAMRSPAVNHIV